jgi:signal transduction histidine kinase
MVPDEAERFKAVFEVLRTDLLPQRHQTSWLTRHGDQRLIEWTTSLLPGSRESSSYVIAAGIDITERKQLEKAILEISAREQRRIGQDLHDGLGQHLTGIAFMAKVHEARLAETNSQETDAAAKIVRLVNEAIQGSAPRGFRRSGPDVRAAVVGCRGGGPVRHILPFSMRKASADS